MESRVSKRGQITIPEAVRRRHGIEAGDVLVWMDDGESIWVVPAPAEAVVALRGRAKGERLMEKYWRVARKSGGTNKLTNSVSI